MDPYDESAPEEGSVSEETTTETEAEGAVEGDFSDDVD